MNYLQNNKWSYLETEALLPSDSTFLKTVPTYRFKVFRYTTRFKKFNLGVTKMVRRKYARRKHQTSWITNSYVAKHWSVHYMKEKQFSRFIQSLGLFNITAGSPSVSVFNTQLRNISNLNGINVVSCSKPVLNKFVSYLRERSYLNPITFGGAAVVVQTHSSDQLISSLEVNPNNIIFDNFQYPRDLTHTSTNNLTTGVFSAFNNILVSHISQNSVSIRRIITLLILLHTNR